MKMKNPFPLKRMLGVAAGALVLCGGITAIALVLQKPAVPVAAPPSSAPESTPVSSEPLRDVHLMGALEGYSLEQLKEKSHVVVVGTITGQSEGFMLQSVPGTTGNFSDYYITPTQVLRGDAELGKEIAVRVEGGAVPPINVISDVDPVFTKGQECLLFLFKHNTGGGYNTEDDNYYWILGRIQGAYIRDPQSPDDNPSFISCHDDSSINLASFAQDMAAVNAECPINPNWVKEEAALFRENNLANGMITQEEYDQSIESETLYATILTNNGQIVRKDDTDTSSVVSTEDDVQMLG